jgi:acetate kinase
MNVLVLNCGSSSIKFQLRDTADHRVLARGLVSRIGEEGAQVELQRDGSTETRRVPVPDHGRGLDLILEGLLDPASSGAGVTAGVSAIGHRVVHGGTYLTAPVLLDAGAIARIEQCAALAPLHNPPALAGIREALRVLPATPQVAVFDTAFHATIPARAHVYALPHEYYRAHGVRRYGFHGISYQAVSQRADALLGGRLGELRVVIAHLGNGASIAAVDRGSCVDTSMGMTPLEGLVMGTRPGDVDPGVLLFMMRELGLSASEVDDVLNKQSGVLGLSGVSKDLRDVRCHAGAGDDRCRLALDLYAYRVKKYVGAFAAAMGGLDALAFTAGVGENDPETRAQICEGLSFLGVDLDPAVNAQTRGVERIISAPDARVRVLVVPTDEERVIADETVAVIGRQGAAARGVV